MSPFAEAYDGRRVLVTGHTGFKGAWLTLWLQHLGAEVAGYSDDVPTDPSLFGLLGMENRIVHRFGDVRNRPLLAAALDEFRPQTIFHLAAQPLVLRSLGNPVDTFEINTMGMVNLLECVRERPWIESVVLVTSDKAYRNEERERGYLETDHLGGHDPYSSSKGCAELVAHSYHHSFLQDSPTTTATSRAGNVIGGGDWATDRIVPDCIRAWITGDSVDVRSPQSTRPWQHVLEPLSGYLWLGARLLDVPSLDGEAFNFGPDIQQDKTVADLLKCMAERWPNANWEIAPGNEQAGREAMLLKLSCEKALQRLGWSAILPFPETVDMTIDWYWAWHEGDEDLYQFSIGQIEHYTRLAKSLDIGWSAP